MGCLYLQALYQETCFIPSPLFWFSVLKEPCNFPESSDVTRKNISADQEAMLLQHPSPRSASARAPAETRQEHQESHRHRPETLGGCDSLPVQRGPGVSTLRTPPAAGNRDTWGFARCPLPAQRYCHLTDEASQCQMERPLTHTGGKKGEPCIFYCSLQV